MRPSVPLVLALAAAAAGAQSPGNYLCQPVESGHSILVVNTAFADRPDEFYPHDVDARRAEVEELLEINARLGPQDITTDRVDVVLPHAFSHYLYENHTPPEKAVVVLRGDALAAAAAAGKDVESYDRVIVLTPKTSWQGSDAIGPARTAFVSAAHPRRNGWLWGHELGHTYTWEHASFLDVPQGTYPHDPGGVIKPYGDAYDVMGQTKDFHWFHPWLAFRAGWLQAQHVPVVTTDGTYTINSLEAPPGTGGHPSAIRVRQSPNEECWIFLRRSEPAVRDGVVLSVGTRDQDRTLLLDMTPGSGGGVEDCELLVGPDVYAWPDPLPDPSQLGYTVQLCGITDMGSYATADVAIAFAAGTTQPPLDELPVIDVVSPSYGATITAPVEFVATAYDPDAVPPGTSPKDGDGIEYVELTLGYYDEAGSAWVAVSETVQAWKHPYVGAIYPPNLPDRHYELRVRAQAKDGGEAVIYAEFVQDFPGQ